MRVLKFGGTSVGSIDSIREVARIVALARQQHGPVAVVVSAMKGCTNALIEMGKRAASGQAYQQLLEQVEQQHLEAIRGLIQVKGQSKVIAQTKISLNELETLLRGIAAVQELSLRTLDLVQSFGERLSAAIIAEYFCQEGISSEMLDARTVVRTDALYGAARVDFAVTNAQIAAYFHAHTALQVITGFIGATEQGVTTTLGRGGSDYTAAIFGAALNAEEIEIWTDVDGVMTADPRVVKNAFSLRQLSYEEAMEISHFGAKVIYPPTLQPAFRKNIPLRILNTFNTDFEGTLVTNQSGDEDLPIKGISSIQDVALLTLSGSGMVGVHGVASRLFAALAQANISIILITQASSEHSITFAIEPKDSERALRAIDAEFTREIQEGKVNAPEAETGLSVLAIVGERMKHRPGIAASMFTALGKNGINIVAIAQGSSELNVSAVIPQKDLSKALNALHEGFFLSDRVTLNLFLLGTGQIGKTLLRQIQEQTVYLLEAHNLRVQLVALANSQHMRFDPEGLSLSLPAQTLLEQGEACNVSSFVARMVALNLPNSIFVDCTPGREGVRHYEDILGASISISTPNKQANSGSWTDYQRYQKAAGRRGAKFCYETNVCAGLPVIAPLRDLRDSGDQIHCIEGVLSGTLSYLFNHYQPGTTFAQVVRQAMALGYTEPDPRDDLSGLDIGRKILILAREAGHALELQDVQIDNILPPSCLQAPTVEAFLEELELHEHVFAKQRDQAAEQGKVLRFVAMLCEGEAAVRLVAVGPESPFYNLSGSDNMVAFTSTRYNENKLVIRGPGAGAEVTAAGVFAEIISIGKYLVH